MAQTESARPALFKEVLSSILRLGTLVSARKVQIQPPPPTFARFTGKRPTSNHPLPIMVSVVNHGRQAGAVHALAITGWRKHHP